MKARVVHLLGPSSGGIRRVVALLAKEPPAGYETAGVVAPANLGSFFEGIPFRPLRGLRPWEELRPDLLHAHGFTAAARAVVGARLTEIGKGTGKDRETRVRPGVIVTVHTAPSQTLRAGSPAESRRLQRLLWRAGRAFAEQADALIAVSQEVAGGLRGSVVIPPAIDLPVATKSRSRVRKELGTPPDRVVVLAVGRLHPDKALHVFIEAVQGTAAEGWIAGEGPERGRLEALAEGTPVRLLGHRDDVGSLMAAADLFALPAAGEAYGFAVMEALAAGLPVVATRVGAVPELAGDAAVIVDPGDRKAFVLAVRRLINDPAARAALAEGARRCPLPSPLELVGRVGEVYDGVLRRNPAPRRRR